MTPPLDTSELQAFTRTVEAGSLSLAARELGVPRPTLGRRLARLEERLGVRLLRRTTRRLALTDAGSILYEQAKNVLEAARVAEASVHQREGVIRGDLRVSVPPIYDESFLAALCAFTEQHPELRVDVTFTSQHVDLLHDADVALRAGASIHPIQGGLIMRAVQRLEMWAVASREYLARKGTPQKPADLLDHDCLVFSKDGRSPRLQWPLRNGQSVRVTKVLASNSFALLRTAARRGRGIALLPSNLVEDDVRSHRLIRVLPDAMQEKMTFAVVYAERKFLSPAIRAFVAWMSERLSATSGARARRPARAG